MNNVKSFVKEKEVDVSNNKNFMNLKMNLKVK